MKVRFWRVTLSLFVLMTLSLPALAEEKGGPQTVLQRGCGRDEPVHLARLRVK